MDLQGQFVYFADNDEGLHIIDVSDPSAPAILSTVDTPGTAWKVAVSNGVAYIADGESGLQVADVSDPMSPALIGSVATPAQALEVGVEGSLVYVGDGTPDFSIVGQLHVIDASNPALPVLIGTFDGMLVQSTGIAVSDGVAYVAGVGAGLLVIDGSVCQTCPWDIDNDGAVGASDLLSLLASWGPCKGCPADFDGDGSVGASDLLALLANWGPCP